jgi:outer membrane protein
MNLWTAISLFGSLAATLAAQSPVTLTQAVEISIRNYPSIQVSQEQMNQAAAGIQLARTAFLPKLDALAQANAATRNNVFGLLLPQSVIPAISGPVLGSNNTGAVWGSALGALVTWEPFDFGLRRANVATSAAAKAHAEASVKRTRFEVAAATTDAFLTIIAAQETVRAAQAGLERTNTIVRTISAQVNSGLRPGADQSRAEAEVAGARTQLIQAEQSVDLAKVNLCQFIGADPAQIEINSGNMEQLPAERSAGSLNTASNPAAIEQGTVIEQAKAQLKALERSYFPKFYLQGSAYARGTGAELNGERLGGLNGLAPTVQNVAVGFSVVFPLMDLPSLRAREAAQAAVIRAESARAGLIALELRSRWNRAVVMVKSARRIAANTPLQVTAATRALEQATARYQAGLSNIDEVAEAQRLLTQAEIEDALARLSVWRSLLGIATAVGDIQPFVAEATR